jgi:hypothetical protein
MTLRQILVVCCWLALATAQACGAGEGEYFAQGNSVRYTPNQTAQVDGEGYLRYRDYQLFADHYTWIPQSRDFNAQGTIKLLHAGATVQGQTLAMNLAKQTGELRPAKGDFRGYFLTSELLVLQPEQLVATRAFLTTCDRPRPDYGLKANKAIVYYSRNSQGQATPEKIQLLGGELQYHGKDIFPLPPLKLNLGGADASRNTLPLPYPGYDNVDGLFVAYRWGTSWQNDLWSLNLDLRQTARRGLRSVIYSDYALAKKDYLRLTLSHREDLRDNYLGPREIATGLSKVLVDKDPELAVNFGDHPLATRIKWQISASDGHYRETPTGASEDRSSLTTGLQIGPFPTGRNLAFETATAYRLAAYGDGDNSRVLYGRLTAKIKPNPDWQLDLSLVGRGFHGASPFRFDQVDLSRELAAELACPLGKQWRGKFLERYDLSRKETRDTGVALTYRAHCLDYNFGWRQSRGLFELSVSLVPETSQK